MTNETVNWKDVTGEVASKPISADALAGKAAPIPPGMYADCTVNVLGVTRYNNSDGSATDKVSIRFTCPSYDGVLEHRFNCVYGTKAPLGGLMRACFTEEQLAAGGVKLTDLNGKRVTMIASAGSFNGKPCVNFAFASAKPTPAPARKG